MKFKRDVSLAKHSTMRLGGPAAYLVEVTKREQVAEAVSFADDNNLPVVMIGNGSNIIWSDGGFRGVVIVCKIKYYDEFKENEFNSYVTVGSGENWDSVVARTTKSGLSGIEAMSLIPGTVGATPIQNVGAYGQEIADTLVSVEAYDRQSKSFVSIPKIDCRFGYRTSRFKNEDKHRFFITGITMHLTRSTMVRPFYQALEDYVKTNNILEYSPETIRNAVMTIRRSKMPDPAVVANSGSFFSNPIVSAAEFKALQTKFPGVIAWDVGEGKYKLAAGWLIEQAGYRGVYDPETGMATWGNQAMVLVNQKAKSTRDLLIFKQKIIDEVSKKMGVNLVPEPEYIGG